MDQNTVPQRVKRRLVSGVTDRENVTLLCFVDLIVENTLGNTQVCQCLSLDVQLRPQEEKNTLQNNSNYNYKELKRLFLAFFYTRKRCPTEKSLMIPHRPLPTAKKFSNRKKIRNRLWIISTVVRKKK